MWYKNVGTSFFRFVILTTHAFDRRTEMSSPCSAMHYIQSHGKKISNVSLQMNFVVITTNSLSRKLITGLHVVEATKQSFELLTTVSRLSTTEET